MDGSNPRTGEVEIGGAPEGLDALVIADALRADGGLALFVARDLSRATQFAQAFAFFAPEMEQITYPAWDVLPYDRLSPTAATSAERMAALSRLARRDAAEPKPLLVVTTVAAATQRTPPRDLTEHAAFSARVGDELDLAALELHFAANGYVRASTVSERGEFAIRGGVVDVFPPGFDEPVRLDLFGSELEQIRCFDPETQRSTGKRDSLTLAPVSEALLTPETISSFRTGWLNMFGAALEQPGFIGELTCSARRATT